MKKLFKLFAWITGLALLLFILLIVGLKLFFPMEKVRKIAITEISERFGRAVEIESLDISVWGGLGVELQRVKIDNPDNFSGQPLFTAENLDLKMKLLPLLSGDVRINRLIIQSPTIILIKNSDGSNNYHFDLSNIAEDSAALTNLPDEAKGVAGVISFDEFEIRDGHLKYTDDSLNRKIELAGLTVSTQLETLNEFSYGSSGRIQVKSIKVSDTIAPNPLAISLIYKMNLDISQGLVNIERGDFSINDLLLKINGTLSDITTNPAFSGNIQTDGQNISDLFKLATREQKEKLNEFNLDGKLSFDLDLEYENQDSMKLDYNGQVVFTDLLVSKKGVNGEFRFSRSLVDIETNKARFNIEDGSFDGRPLKGHLLVMGFDNPIVSGEFSGGLDLSFAQTFIPDTLVENLQGDSEFRLKFEGAIKEPESMSYSGEIRITDGKLNSPFFPESINELTLKAYFDKHLLKIDELSFNSESGGLKFTGRFSDLISFIIADSLERININPAVEGSLDGSVSLKIIEPYLTFEGNPEISGIANFDLSLIGNVKELNSFKPRGSISIAEGKYSDSLLPEPIEKFSLELTIQPDTIVVTDLSVKFNTTDLSLNGKLSNPFPYFLPITESERVDSKKPFIEFSMVSHRFDIDKMFPEAVPGSGRDSSLVISDSISTVILPDINGRGNIKFDTLIYAGVELTDINGLMKIQDRKIEVYDVAGTVYTGAVSGQTTIDLSDLNQPRYTGRFKATQIETDGFLSQFTKFGGYLFGKANMEGSYDAVGWEPEQFLNSLTLDGQGNIRDGKLVTSGAIYKQFSELASRLGQKLEPEQALRNLASAINVKDGRVSIDKMKFALGDLGDLSVNGFYAFDESIEYKGELLLSDKNSLKLLKSLGSAGDLLKGRNSERLAIPLIIVGSLSNPKPSLDYSLLSKNLGKKLKEQAGDFLKGLFKKK